MLRLALNGGTIPATYARGALTRAIEVSFAATRELAVIFPRGPERLGTAVESIKQETPADRLKPAREFNLFPRFKLLAASPGKK